MDKREFINEVIRVKNNYVGKLPLKEIFRLGVMHKTELSQIDKSWENLANLVGWEGSPNSLRCWVSRQMEHLVTDASSEEKVLNKELVELYKEKTKVRDTYNAYRRTIRDEARIDDLKETITEAARKIAESNPFPFEPSGETEEELKNREAEVEAVLCLSDLHIGVECDNYYNKYDTKIAEERLAKLACRVNEYCARNNVYRLSVLNLGDMIHGIIHTNARLEAQLDVAEQIITAGELLSKFLAFIQFAAPVINYYSVFDNHSRAIADKNEHVEKEQFSRVIDWFIEERLRESNINFCKNDIDGGIGRLSLINGKKLIFSHGHQDNKNSSMQNFVGLTREWVDYVCMAHYHNPATKDFQGCKVFINGSIVGTEQYAFGRRLFSEPSQKLIVFDKDDTFDIDIKL